MCMSFLLASIYKITDFISATVKAQNVSKKTHKFPSHQTINVLD